MKHPVLKDIDVFYPTTISAWRKWLEKHHQSRDSVWVVFYNKHANKKTITWSDAVDVALCFGWIDSKKVKIDADCSHQFFSKRKPKSTWSKINKDKVERLIQTNQMTEIGMAIIETAKQNGSWTILDDAEALVVPPELAKKLQSKPGVFDHFMGLSKSRKKLLLMQLTLAKQPITKQKRIDEIVTHLLSDIKKAATKKKNV